MTLLSCHTSLPSRLDIQGQRQVILCIQEQYVAKTNCMMGLALCGRCLHSQGPRLRGGERWGKVGWPKLAHAAASHRAFEPSQPSTSQPFPSRRPGQGQAGGIGCCCTSLLDSFPPAKAPLIRHALGKSCRRRCLLEKCWSIEQEFPQRMVGGHAA